MKTFKELVDALGGPAMFGVHMLGLLLALGAIFVLWRAQANKDNLFNAAEMFLDERDRTSGSKFVALIASLASVWIVVYLTVAKEIDATLFLGWLTILVVGKIGTEAIEKFRTTQPPPPVDQEKR